MIIALTLTNTPAGLYFVLKSFSFVFTIHLAYNDTSFIMTEFVRSIRWNYNWVSLNIQRDKYRQ
jgi:hypothetical protein